jgi:hypothetical protein
VLKKRVFLADGGENANILFNLYHSVDVDLAWAITMSEMAHAQCVSEESRVRCKPMTHALAPSVTSLEIIYFKLETQECDRMAGIS